MAGCSVTVTKRCNGRPLGRARVGRYWLTSSGYTQPPTLAVADAAAGGAGSVAAARVLKQLPAMFNSDGLTVTQVPTPAAAEPARANGRLAPPAGREPARLPGPKV